MKRLFLISASLVMMYNGFAQSGLFEPKEMLNAYENETRSRDGVPGMNYWQNTITYDLKAELDPESKILKGTGFISYYNNSPDTLRYMIIKLLPNIHKTGNARDYAVGEHISDGMIIDSIAINSKAEDILDRRKFREFGTNLYVIFGSDEKIAPGSRTDIYVSWNYEVIEHGIRTGAFTDSSFFIGYWYPQIAVYDDVYGWDREDYTGKQETYNDLGVYDVEITVPGDYIVWATGDQLNEEEIFSDQTLNLIQKSRESSETINIATSESYINNEIFKKGHSNTWKFRAEDVPDFAWACSNSYNWDANTITLKDDNNRKIWINTAYPDNTSSFDQVADIAHQGIEFLSNVFPAVPYPFDKHITFNGIDYIGVEFPMMANNGDHAQEEMYTELTVHEIAHNYIPFFMLSNERKNAWIDEGWVKLMGELYGESLGLRREDKEQLNSLQVYERIAGSSNDLPLIVSGSFMATNYNYYHSYAKASIANMLLLDMMKEKGVDQPLKEFLLTWEGKHPTPHDFFYFMSKLYGEDLSWFWNAWYYEFNSADLAILKGEDANQVIVENQGGLPLPVKLTVVYNNDKEKVIEKSVFSWKDRATTLAVEIPDLDDVRMITLGAPDIPDVNDENNVLVL